MKYRTQTQHSCGFAVAQFVVLVGVKVFHADGFHCLIGEVDVGARVDVIGEDTPTTRLLIGGFRVAGYINGNVGRDIVKTKCEGGGWR